MGMGDMRGDSSEILFQSSQQSTGDEKYQSIEAEHIEPPWFGLKGGGGVVRQGM